MNNYKRYCEKQQYRFLFANKNCRLPNIAITILVIVILAKFLKMSQKCLISVSRKQKTPNLSVFLTLWSRRRESNSQIQLGRLMFYH